MSDCRECGNPAPGMVGVDVICADCADCPEQSYDGGGWPGDGSGTDDFADMNANEADDYRNEGE